MVLQRGRRFVIIDFMVQDASADTGGTNPPRIRLIIDTTDRLRHAVQVRAFKLSAERGRKVSVSDFVNELLESVLQAELKTLAHSDPPPPQSPKKPGRKPKSGP